MHILNEYLKKYEPLHGKTLRHKGKTYRVRITGSNIVYPQKVFIWDGTLEDLDASDAYIFSDLTDGETFAIYVAALDKALTKVLQ